MMSATTKLSEQSAVTCTESRKVFTTQPTVLTGRVGEKEGATCAPDTGGVTRITLSSTQSGVEGIRMLRVISLKNVTEE